FALPKYRRGLITCGFEPQRGELDPLLLARFAQATGYPVLVDACNPLRLEAPAALKPFLLAPFEPLLRIPGWLDGVAPEIVIQIGRPLLSAAFERWLTSPYPLRATPHVIVLARRGWPDPSGMAEFVGNSEPNDTLARALSHWEESGACSSNEHKPWQNVASAVEEGVDSWLEASKRDCSGALGELVAVHVLLNALPTNSRLVIGNSLSVRQIDLVATRRTPAIKAEALRGASGIDGVVSTGAGFALAGDMPTTLVLGDISLLHDVGGLWAASRAPVPFVIIVLNNGGGRIFEQLPVASAVDPSTLPYWTTPQGFDLAHAAALFGIVHVRAATASSLEQAIHAAHRRLGATLVEVMVEQDSAKKQAERLVAEVHAAVERLGAQ
ncbi:MAG TPA: thiamine pyrophosphate-dependent enzyme, partial [Polyangiaceae bacterium]|nr:thiamine pyrophosphate-dependent enzyme [Polyangiaceae bacterium]